LRFQEERKYRFDLASVLKGQVRELGNVHALKLSELYHMRPENFESMEDVLDAISTHFGLIWDPLKWSMSMAEIIPKTQERAKASGQ
jgi:hypothetical protein